MNFIKLFHQFRFIRQIAKKLFKNTTVKQNFYQGKICLNAVEHSWAWTGQNRYESFDIEIQHALYDASFTHDLLVDIGCNIGVMSVGTLLHNPKIKVIALDPNTLANKLLNCTLKLNKLEGRCQIINAAVGVDNGFVYFDETGSVTGHISTQGKKTKLIKLSGLLNQNQQLKTLVKIDVEGYETILMDNIKNITNLTDFTFFIEVHEKGFNGVGDPEEVFASLKNLNAVITNLKGQFISSLLPNIITQIIVKF